MFYIAKCYIGHAGVTLRPGDVFEADGQDDKIDWLLSQNAIAPATPAFAPAQSEDYGNDSEDDGVDADSGSEDDEGFDDESDGVAEEDEEAFEIDGLEGVIAADAEAAEPAAENAAKKRGRKKA